MISGVTSMWIVTMSSSTIGGQSAVNRPRSAYDNHTPAHAGSAHSCGTSTMKYQVVAHELSA